ncbi:hypothetical protein KQI84_12705 [bacterium]|nr:hypothetical protein [bacterium]
MVQNTLEQWLSFKKYLNKSFGEEDVTPEDESNFLEVKSAVARNVRSVGERLKEMKELDYGGSAIRDLLNKCVSVGHLRALPAADKRALYKDWHGVFVRLSRTVGALKFMSEGYIPRSQRAAGKKKKGGGGSKGKVIAIVVVVVAVVGGIAYALLGL